MTAKESRDFTRSKIVEYALQIVRLKTMGVSIDKDGNVHSHCHSDVPNQIKGHELLLESEARFLLAQLTIGGEADGV